MGKPKGQRKNSFGPVKEKSTTQNSLPNSFLSCANSKSKVWLCCVVDDHTFMPLQVHWYGRQDTNMKAKTWALWGLLWFAHHLYIEKISIFGDSQVLIDHLNKGTALNPEQLTTWMERIEIMRKNFTTIVLSHIHVENNSRADRLSKKGLTGKYGEMQ